MSTVTHLRPITGGGPVCQTKAKGSIRTTASPSGADCGRCRKAAGLGKYNAMDALHAIFPIKLNAEPNHYR